MTIAAPHANPVTKVQSGNLRGLLRVTEIQPCFNGQGRQVGLAGGNSRWTGRARSRCVQPQNAEHQGANDDRGHDHRQGDELRAGQGPAPLAAAGGVHILWISRATPSTPRPMKSVAALGSISRNAAARNSARSSHVAVRRK